MIFTSPDMKITATKKDTDVNRDFHSTHKGEHIEDVSAVSAIQNLK